MEKGCFNYLMIIYIIEIIFNDIRLEIWLIQGEYNEKACYKHCSIDDSSIIHQL
ncbi:protein of unknown function [Petrocella atlantisensis]|uniref:Uncharacterized protein n=1 Tax=Petrocella atlantisensis TaxID=2173034 RepID=A0A3P7RWJ2_9FIRM|nr:protein of unknown function [Petrocella atlantisensis]